MALGKLQLVANGHLLALHFGTSNLGPSLCKGSTAPISAPWGSSRTRIINGANFRIGSLDDAIAPNALRRKWDLLWSGGGFSLGLDLGLSRTGVALSKGFSFRPLTVLEMRGQKLELRIIEIAEKEEADEFIIGLPKSSDGKETPQSNKVRSVAGRLAVRAAERGWRVYLQDEHGTSVDAMNRMINLGVRKSARQGTVDAYAAVMVLERYFSTSGEETELVLPKQQKLQKMIRKGPPKDDDFFLL